MIVQELFEVNGRRFIHTFSDEKRYVERDGDAFSEAYDPEEFHRVYTEGGLMPELDEMDAYIILIGGKPNTVQKTMELRTLIEKAAVSLTDEDALEAVELFPAWAPGTLYNKGERIRYGGKLYKILQDHTSQDDWKPDSTPSLYAEVAKPGQGDTPDNPIPYNGNMELVENKYYSEDGVVYRCIRSTGVPVYNRLADLVNIYVEVVS